MTCTGTVYLDDDDDGDNNNNEDVIAKERPLQKKSVRFVAPVAKL